jgi:hypothetical protein
MATLAETSAPTLSAYETGHKEPRLSTLSRIAEANGMELEIRVRPRLTEPERRSLALHRAVASKLAENPERVRELAVRNLETMRGADAQGHASQALDEWERLVSTGDETLTDTLTSLTQRARSLRQSSPFAGVLSRAELLAALESERRLEEA